MLASSHSLHSRILATYRLSSANYIRLVSFPCASRSCSKEFEIVPARTDTSSSPTAKVTPIDVTSAGLHCTHLRALSQMPGRLAATGRFADKAAEIVREFLCRLVAVDLVDLDRFANDCSQIVWQRFPLHTIPAPLSGSYLPQHLRAIRDVEQRTASQELIQRHPQRINVGALVENFIQGPSGRSGRCP